jgi:predicted DNA-binding transcriptional regulator AlpA
VSNQEPDERRIYPILWKMTDVAMATSLSTRTITRLRAAGRLPAPDASYGRLPRWFPRTIESWIANGGLSEALSAK